MAYDILEKDNPDVLDKANDLLKVLQVADPKLTEKEQNYPFVEAAPLADWIKFRGGSWQSPWHFINIPFFNEGGNASDFEDFGASEKNITSAISGIMDWIRGRNGYENNFVY